MFRALVVLSLFVCSAGAALAGGAVRTSEEFAVERVRTTNPRIRQALREGQQKAPTFRELVAELQGSDVILHIEPGECSCGGARSCVSFVTSTGPVRYLRATVSLRQIQKELIAQIGHELFHATEIAGAAEIVNTRALEHFYKNRGRATCGLPCGDETTAAVRVQARLRAELETPRAIGSPR